MSPYVENGKVYLDNRNEKNNDGTSIFSAIVNVCIFTCYKILRQMIETLTKVVFVYRRLL